MRPTEYEMVVCLPDIHGHLVDRAAFGVALGFITENRVDKVIVQGDGIDLEALSHFKRSLAVKQQLAYEQECGRNIRAAIDKASGSAEKEWQEGNHERRLRDFLMMNADELSGLVNTDDSPMLDVPGIIGLRENGWDYTPTTAGKSTYSYAGSICVGHFDVSRKVPGSAALGLMNDRNESVLQAHTHKIGGGVKRFPNGRTIMGYEIGCLCDLSPSYCTDPTWAHGFAILRRERGSKRFDFHQVNICGGEASIDGVRYTA